MLLGKSIFITLCSLFTLNNGQLQFPHARFGQFPLKAAQRLTERLREKLSQYRDRTTQMICYDAVGCFSLPHKNSPLQRIPEDPRALETKFYLFTSKNVTHPEILYYDDEGKTLKESNFNVFSPLKVLIHGYTSKWNEKGALMLKDAYLKMYKCNVVLMDWKMGARGPYYASAAANTELVGRELGILLVNMVENGLDPKNIHLIGFSLGAHVAGTASEPLKQKGHMIGRITGLDAASPLFRREYFKEKNKKLDRSDATFVDVLHTDSSPFLTDGFGIWEPIGHVDFFPNGGQEQPGCTDPRSSIVVTHLEGRGLSRDSACSHVRAFHLFLESLTNKMALKKDKGLNHCQFIAYSCPGGMPSFEKGHCFPLVEKNFTDLHKFHEIGQFGEDVKGRGVMYFSTKESSPYCGTQLQASVYISQKTAAAEGILRVIVSYLNKGVTFDINTNGKDLIMTGSRMSGLTVADFNSLNPETVKSVNTYLYFFNTDEDMTSNGTLDSSYLYVDKILVRDIFGNSWQYCEKDMLIGEQQPKQVLLTTGNYC